MGVYSLIKKDIIISKTFTLINGEDKLTVSKSEALQLANDLGLDLVWVNQDPLVGKLMDYKRHLFEQKKSKKQQTSQETKEIKLKPNTDEHDFNVRLKQTNEFLKEGHKVKITIFHKGRQAVHPELGKEQLDRLLNSCDPHKVVQEPNMEGKKLSITIVKNE